MRGERDDLERIICFFIHECCDSWIISDQKAHQQKIQCKSDVYALAVYRIENAGTCSD